MVLLLFNTMVSTNSCKRTCWQKSCHFQVNPKLDHGLSSASSVRGVSCFNRLRILFLCTINLTFICIVGVTYSMIGCMVLNKCSCRNINCVLGKICYCLISISVSLSCPFKQCLNGGFCWFSYHVSTHLFTDDTFIHFVADLLFYCYIFNFNKKKRNIQTLVLCSVSGLQRNTYFK